MSEVADSLRAAALAWPDRPAVTAGGCSISYAEYDALASAAANGIARAGIVEGDRLALIMKPSPEYLVILQACFRLGVVACPLNPRFPNKALVEMVSIARCVAIVADSEFEPPECNGLARLFPSALVETPRNSRVEPLSVLDRPAAIIFTSGSSGSPKAALLSLANLCANAAASNRNIPVAPGDAWLLSLPLHHVSGLGVLFRCMLGGGAVAIPETGDGVGEAIPRLHTTHVSLVATQLHRLLAAPRHVEALAGLKAILLGGSAIPRVLVEAAFERGLPIHTTYGLTETASQIATTPPGADLDTLLTSGMPLNPETVRLADDGEILVRGESLFMGYVEAEDVVCPLTTDGWFRTRDLGAFDREGRLIVRGRKDNLFISGGENIQPEEIEAVLGSLEEVVLAIVVPVEDAEYGHRPLAFLQTLPGRVIDPAAIARRLADVLPSWRLPIAYLPWPVDAAVEGIKANRNRLREIANRRRC